MVRTGPQKIPGANLSLFFGGGRRYTGSDMEVNCAVAHTTEGATLYDYGGGSEAPTVTAVPDFNARRLAWYQHFDVDESARALVNAPGGVQTNTANVFQIELVGTCDPSTHADWARRGVQHIYWPDPPDWAVRDLAWLMRWLRDEHGIPLTSGLEWLPYPASYGASRVRMSFAQWTNFRGWCGHQHVPENDHGDPGALPIERLLAVAAGQTQPTTTPAPTAPSTEEEDPLAARTDDELIALIVQAVKSTEARDAIAYAVRRYEGDGPSVAEMLDQLPARVWDEGLPNVGGDWQQKVGADATVPARWLAAAANPMQIQLAAARAELAAQAAVVRTLLDRTAGVDTAAVEAAITAAVDRSLAALDVHLTATPKESS